MKITAVIRARNCATDLEGCLAALARQNLPHGTSLDVVVVDNESDDGSADVARAAGASVITLRRDEFSWGRALNLGIAAAAGDVVILLSADAHPANNGFAAAITAAFSDPNVAAVYGRQIPRTDAPIDEIARLQKTFGEQKAVYDCNSRDGLVASNACAAIRRSVWQNIPYDEELEGAEEWGWMDQVFAAGHLALYEPSAEVFHSHNDPIFRCAVRAAELYIIGRKMAGRNPHLAGLVRWMAGNIRRRVINCARVRGSKAKRIEGLARIPLETVATIVAYTVVRPGDRQPLRAALWDFRFSS